MLTLESNHQGLWFLQALCVQRAGRQLSTHFRSQGGPGPHGAGRRECGVGALSFHRALLGVRCPPLSWGTWTQSICGSHGRADDLATRTGLRLCDAEVWLENSYLASKSVSHSHGGGPLTGWWPAEHECKHTFHFWAEVVKKEGCLLQTLLPHPLMLWT